MFDHHDGIETTKQGQVSRHHDDLTHLVRSHASCDTSCIASRFETTELLMGEPCISMTAAGPGVSCWGLADLVLDELLEGLTFCLRQMDSDAEPIVPGPAAKATRCYLAYGPLKQRRRLAMSRSYARVGE
jgi:hypothetical protein